MRTPSPTRRLAATLGAAGLLAVLAVPAGALATDSACDPLVTHTPTGSEGDVHAVAITSQALEADTPGWVHVGWQAAEGTSVSEVVITREEGVERRTEGDLAAGHAEEVLEIAFCGEVADSSEAGPADEPADAPAAKEPAREDRSDTVPSETSSGSEHPAEETPAEAQGSDGPTADGDDTETASATTTSEPDPQPTEPDAPSADTSGDADTDTASLAQAPDEDDVEVLGVTLTAPDESPAGAGHETTEVTSAAAPLAGNDTSLLNILVGGLAGMIAALGALASARHLQRKGVR